MVSQVKSLDDWFEDMAKNISGKQKYYPFNLRVLVAGYRVTPRHRMFQYFLETGVLQFPPILRHERFPLAPKSNLFFVLPERHLSIHEQQAFLDRLGKHPQAKDIARVDLVTQCPLILTGVPRECIAIFEIENTDKDAGLLSNEMR